MLTALSHCELMPFNTRNGGHALINPQHVSVTRHEGIAVYRAVDKPTARTNGRLIEMIEFDFGCGCY